MINSLTYQLIKLACRWMSVLCCTAGGSIGWWPVSVCQHTDSWVSHAAQSIRQWCRLRHVPRTFDGSRRHHEGS